jgi:hypothetical protein
MRPALVGGVPGRGARSGGARAGEVDVVDAVVLTSAVDEAAFVSPELGVDLVQNEPSLLGDLAAGDVIEPA